MKRKPNGWDKRDYELWSDVQQLPSYGLIAGGGGSDRMVSRAQVIALLETHAERRYDEQRATALLGDPPDAEAMSKTRAKIIAACKREPASAGESTGEGGA